VKFWMFTPEQLQQKRIEVNKNSREQQQNAKGASSSDSADKDYITPPEEDLLRRHYEFKIQDIARLMQLPDKVQATAITFLKRFFLSYSVMDHDPLQIMLASVYVACKTEEHHISAEEFGKTLSVNCDTILEMEIVLLQGLHFQFVVYHPYTPLHGFIIDLKEKRITADTDSVWTEATAIINRLLTTDAALLYSPSQIALAALSRACKNQKKDLSGYMAQFASLEQYPVMIGCLAKIDALIDAAGSQKVDSGEVKRVDRKLKFCRNPELNPASEEFQKRRERKRKEKEDKRQVKLRKVAEKERMEALALTGFNPNGTPSQPDDSEFVLHTRKRKSEG